MPVRQPLHLIPPRRKTGRGGGNVFGADGPLPFVRRWRRSARKDCVRKRAVPCGWLLSVSLLVSRVFRDKRFRADAGTNVPDTGGPEAAGAGAVSEHAAASVRSGGSYARPGGRSGTGSFGTGACGAGKRPCGMRSGLALCGGGKRPAVVRPLRPSTGNPFLRDKRTVRPAVAGRSRRGTFVFRPVSRFVSLGRMPVQGGRKRPKGDLQKQVALRFMCPTVARRKIPRQGKPSGALVRAVGAGPTRDQLTDGRNEYSVEYSIIWAG